MTTIIIVACLPEDDTTFGVVLSSLIAQYIGLTKYVKKVFPIEKADDDDGDIISSCHPK